MRGLEATGSRAKLPTMALEQGMRSISGRQQTWTAGLELFDIVCAQFLSSADVACRSGRFVRWLLQAAIPHYLDESLGISDRH